MQQLTWDQFDACVATLAQRWRDRSFTGLYGVPRGGLCLAVALSHALDRPLLDSPDPSCLIVDDVYESGRTLNALHAQFPDACFLVWMSKQPLDWWDAAVIVTRDEWLVFPWENRERAHLDEQAYRLSHQVD